MKAAALACVGTAIKRDRLRREVDTRQRRRREEIIEGGNGAAAPATDVENVFCIDVAVADKLKHQLYRVAVEVVFGEIHLRVLLFFVRSVAIVEEDRERAELGAVELSGQLVVEAAVAGLVFAAAKLYPEAEILRRLQN